MKKQLSTVLIAILTVSGCSWLPSMSSLNPFAEGVSEAESEAPAEESIGVNPYLWQAALTKLSFMPLASADSAGGVIITDWAAMDNIQNEQFKITVNILSRNLRADCLKVAVFKRVLRDGKWVNDTADRRLAGEIENAILTQARKLYRRDLAAREE
ncbi:MAG: DUF3576 domain-containing protein [Alphaproteobacteria bacterium]|nr:DUF3576 domain-containing protein [Alphaproteobacteria bacterium]